MGQDKTQEEMNALVQEHGALLASFCMVGCFNCLITMFDLGWYVWGVTMALGEGCPKATSFFWKILLFSVGGSVVNMAISSMFSKKPALAREPIIDNTYSPLQSA